MPRAYYKPFTMYEEVVGFKRIQTIAKGLCAFMFGGFVLKIILNRSFSGGAVRRVEDMSPEEMELHNRRSEMAEGLFNREKISRHIQQKKFINS